MSGGIKVPVDYENVRKTDTIIFTFENLRV